MTIKDLYEMSTECKCENYEIRLQYQDGGGSYCGDTDVTGYEIRMENNELLLY